MVFYIRGLCFCLLLSLLAIVPAASAEGVNESAELKEVYIHDAIRLDIKYLRHDAQSLVVKATSKTPYTLKECFGVEGTRVRLYLIHQCLKLFD